MEVQEKIPRIIHYCWFGRGEKSSKIQKCIKSWKKYLSDYEFVEWNEDNFDLKQSRYVKEAYDARKFAFVSDYVRLYALHRYGGIYLDTDVEVVRPLNELLVHDAFTGFEDDYYLQSATMGATKEHPWIKSLLDDYSSRSFLLPDGTYDMLTNTAKISELCKKQGLILNGQHQQFGSGVVCYPRTSFSPYDYINGGNFITGESYTIHHFAQSWLPAHVRAKSGMKRIAGRIVGPVMIAKMRKIFTSHS